MLFFGILLLSAALALAEGTGMVADPQEAGDASAAENPYEPVCACCGDRGMARQPFDALRRHARDGQSIQSRQGVSWGRYAVWGEAGLAAKSVGEAANRPERTPRRDRAGAPGAVIDDWNRPGRGGRGRQSALDVLVMADRDVVFAGPSEIVFQITVRNNGGEDMENVAIAKGDAGICVIDVVAPGEAVTLFKALSTSGGERFQFTATAKDHNGNIQAYQSNVCQIASRRIRIMPPPQGGVEAGARMPGAESRDSRPQMQPLHGALPFVAVMLMLALTGRR